MHSYPDQERYERNGRLHARSRSVESQPPGLDRGERQHHEALERPSPPVAVEIQDKISQNDKVVQAVIDAVTGPLFLLDREQRIVLCNAAAAKPLGRSVHDVVGLAMPEYLAAVASACGGEQRIARTADPFDSAASGDSPDPRDAAWDNTIGPVVAGNGQIEGVVSARDISEYGKRRRQAEQLVSLGMISVTLAHELAQPLSAAQLAIQTASAELERRNGPEVVQRDLQTGLAACARLHAMIKCFQDFARPPARTKEIEVSIHLVAERTCRLLEQSARQAKMSLGTENLEALPALRMRENELEQLFFILIQNAVQAADGWQERHLRITGTRRKDAVVLRFQDNCGGIEPAHLSRIFEPFFTTKPRGQGTGLGLCIARRIVCQRGGQITVDSRPGEGATFTVTLPQRPRRQMGGRYVP